jgi:hypothetical protein
MDEEEFPADDVWFGSQFRYIESQGLELIEDNQQGDEIAVEDGPVDGTVALNIPHEETLPTEFPTGLPTVLPTALSATAQETPTALQDQDVPSEEVDGEEDPDAALKPRAKRNTYSYGKKMTLASYHLFLDDLYKDKFTDPLVLIRGQIKECPRASNGKQFRLEWKEPLPVGVERLWLRSHLVASSDSKGMLQEATSNWRIFPNGLYFP